MPAPFQSCPAESIAANLSLLVSDRPEPAAVRVGVRSTNTPPGGSCVNGVRARRTSYFAPDSNGCSYALTTGIMGVCPMSNHSPHDLGSTIPSEWSMRTEFHSSSDLNGCPMSATRPR